MVTPTIIQINNDELNKLIGPAEASGIWLIYGEEKNGKTWLALQLAKALAAAHRVAYISAEEGIDESFKLGVKRAGLVGNEAMNVYAYSPLQEVIATFKNRRRERVIFIDNLTIYSDELKAQSGIKKLERELSGKLLICIAHEERKKPYPACASMARKMAKVIFHVRGLSVFVTSRYSAGGELTINEDKATAVWGSDKQLNDE